MPFLTFRKTIAKAISDYCGARLSPDAIEQQLAVPPGIELGHIALPCFGLSKTLRRPPNNVATEMAHSLALEGITATAAGPYVNFKLNASKLGKITLEKILTDKEKYSSEPPQPCGQIVIEYCSPNIAKKLPFQNIRSSLIGNTLANIYTFLGYKTVRLNFVGDWGSQFARLLSAVDLWGNRELLAGSDSKAAMNHLFELYVRFHKEIEANPTLAEKASRSLQLLENHDKNAVELWRRIRDISLAAMDATLRRMSVHFDCVEGESTYIPAMDKTLQEVKEKASARLSEGAYVVDIDGMENPALIQKRDGTTLYLTRDVAAAMDRYNRFKFEKMIYVVGEQQKLHFRQLFAVLKKMGLGWANQCEHVAFGTILFESGRMSTREGKVVFLDDLLEEAKEMALQECMKKNPDLKSKDEVAEMVGTGAVIFGELSMHRERDFQFNWEQVLALDGETGPYVQYALVRCHSLLEKQAEQSPEALSGAIPDSYPYSEGEETLVLCLAKFRLQLNQCVKENEPYYLTRYLIDLAKAFNRFYYGHPVLQATDPAQRNARVLLVRATSQVLSNGLALLGIACPTEM